MAKRNKPDSPAPEAVENVVVAQAEVAAAPELHVVEVEIPNCLLGRKVFVVSGLPNMADMAAVEADALRQYKELGGITSYLSVPKFSLFSVGSEGYVAAESAWREAKAAEVK